MQDGDTRWVEVSRSQFAHEREGLDSVRAWLPTTAPYRAWSNFEFRDSHGGWHECDLLVLGPGGLYLVEFKHYYGVLSGDDYTWRRNGRAEKSPLLLARRKAQRLASKLKDAAADWAAEGGHNPREVAAAVPYIHEAVFLHHREFVSHMTGSSAIGLYGLEDAEATSNLPPLSWLLTQPPEPGRELRASTDHLIPMLMARIGLVQRREREAGSWIIQEGVVDEGVSAHGFAWQDWLCTHVADPARRGRVRIFLYPPRGSNHEIQRRKDVARNEFRLSRTLRHDAILTPEDYVDAEMGPGLVYADQTDFLRLDLWLAEHSPVPLETALSIVRQIAEGLAYAHSHGVAHRTLGADAIWLRPRRTDPTQVEAQIRGWSFAGGLEASTSGVTAFARDGTVTSTSAAEAPDAADRWLSEAFRAPESQWNTDDRVRLDVFSLGALAAYIVTGRAPATSAAELRQSLGASQAGIDIATLGGAAPEELRAIIRAATHPVVGTRTAKVAEVLDALDAFTAALTAAEDDRVNPLEALPGATLAGGRFAVDKRLGKGSTARGLLVTDHEAPGAPRRVLKVALDDSAAARLAAEAEVLGSLGTAKTVARLIEGPIDVGGCTALLLESAGTMTLAEELRTGIPVPIDFLESWGKDLLDAVVELDRLGVDHRDIKPGNLGVRSKNKKAQQLVLFDFSLTRAPVDEIEAGTPPYRDPFLGTGRRQRFDSAADRYSAAVVLFEMATGHHPQYGDGMTLPSLISDEATIDATDFARSLAGELTDFFRVALRRDAAERFDSAAAMREAWKRVFSTGVTTQAATDEDDRRAEAATLDTPLDQAGLTPRALSALARFKVHTVRDFLLKVDAGHPYPGVKPATRNHLKSRRAAWEKELGLPRPVNEGALSDGLEVIVRALIAACGPDKATVRRALVQLILGETGRVDAFAAPMSLAHALPERVQPARVKAVLEEALSAWAADTPSRDVLDALGAALERRITELGGALTLGESTAAVLDAAHEPLRSRHSVRRAQGLVRLALERRRALRALGGAAADLKPISVRRHEGVVTFLGAAPELFDALHAVGQAAEQLVVRSAGAQAAVIVPATTAARELDAALEPFTALFAPADDAAPAPEATSAPRLIRVGAELAPHAAVAATLDLHHVDLPQTVALAETFRGYASAGALEAREVRQRVRERFPAVPALPERPALDELVAASGADLRWDEARFGYVVPPRSLSTTGLASHAGTIPARGSVGSLKDVTAARLAESIETRSFLALGVRGQEAEAMAGLLATSYGADVLDVTGLLIDAMHAAADQHGVPWAVIVTSDARPEGSGDRTNLEQLVTLCLPDVWGAIDAAIAGGDEGRPVLLTEVAPLARYRHLGELARWSDVARPRRRAVWVLAPQAAGSRGPVIDGRPLPLGSPGQYVEPATDWAPPPRPGTGNDNAGEGDTGGHAAGAAVATSGARGGTS